MRRAILIAGLLATRVLAQNTFTWQQVKDRFEATNPTMLAARIGIDESKAQETTEIGRAHV